MHSCLTTGCVSRVTLVQVDQGPALHHSQTYPYLTAPRPGQPPKQHPAFLSVSQICHYLKVNDLAKFGVILFLILKNQVSD